MGSNPVGGFLSFFKVIPQTRMTYRKTKTPSVGIEPTAIGLKGQRSTIWARKASDMNSNIVKNNYEIFTEIKKEKKR